MKKFILILATIICLDISTNAQKVRTNVPGVQPAETQTSQMTNFVGVWIDGECNFKLLIKQSGNRISGNTYSTSHGGDIDDVQYSFSGTVANNGIATVTFYSDYWECNMKASIRFISPSKIEWIQIPQKGRDMPVKVTLTN